MGTRGPAPARSDERRRANKPDTPVDKVAQADRVVVPAAESTWHPAAASWYESLASSGQSRFYEPSDWQSALFCASLMTRLLNAESVNAQLVAQVRGLMADLLVTESARRRVSLEVVRPPQPQPSGDNVTSMTDRRQRLSDAS